VLAARSAQETTPAVTTGTDVKAKDKSQTIQSLGSTSLASAVTSATGANAVSATAPSNNTTSANSISANSPSALAATVTALHQSGQNGAVLRLDPPGLGHLSVQVGLNTQGQVNVLFVPSTADAAQALHAALPQLGNAMAQSGLTLGQAQVGGQFSQSGGQQQSYGQNGGYTPPAQTVSAPTASPASTTITGLSAYA
jgi:flagellar hook-length control protein FliK